MFNNFSEMVKACEKPTSAILKETLSSRANFSPQESDFVTYLAGFTHHEFAEELYDEFGFIFLKDVPIFYDSKNKKFHIKVLINGRTYNFDSLELSNIASAINSPIFKNFLKRRNEKGFFVDKISKEELSMNGSELKCYLSKCKLGIVENVLSYRTLLENIQKPLIIHFTSVAMPNVPINLGTIFFNAFACIFINSLDEMPNSSLYKIQEQRELHCLLSQIYWFVIDVQKPEKVIDFLSGIEATYRKVLYRGDSYDYFSDLLLDIKTRIANQCSKFLEVNSDPN